MEPFHNDSSKPMFEVYIDEEDGQRVVLINKAWARQYLAEFGIYCKLARQHGFQVPSEQYAFARQLETLI